MNDNSNNQTALPSVRKINLQAIIWLVSLAVIAGIIGYLYWSYTETHPSTEDAYIQGDIVNVASQVSGQVANIYVTNNQMVKKGNLLFLIEPSPFKFAVQQAEAELELAKQNYRALLEAVKVAQAEIAEQQAQLTLDQKDYTRDLNLSKKGYISKAQLDAALAKLNVTQAGLQSAKEQLSKIRQQIGDPGEQNAAIKQARAALETAKLNLQHTIIVAPSNGTVTNFSLRPGTVVTAGQPIFAFVEQDNWWVAANFKETQLTNIKPGQAVKITIDMYPGYVVNGIVESISPGSGASFSLLPPEESSGNWVKVTRRFPVRIKITSFHQDHPLRVGSSATVVVDTRTTAVAQSNQSHKK